MLQDCVGAFIIKLNIREGIIQMQRFHEVKSIKDLVKQIEKKHASNDKQKQIQIDDKRRMHYSHSYQETCYKKLRERPLFDNKTKEGELIDTMIKIMPYKFIPKYKNQTFIMPERVFQKGKKGKRFYIKMKDTSIQSFPNAESVQQKTYLKNKQKLMTILSRQVEEFDRISNVENGQVKCRKNKQFLQTNKIFRYAGTNSQEFSISQPILQPKETQKVHQRKISVTRSMNCTEKWQPIPRKSQILYRKTTEIRKPAISSFF